MTIHWKADEQYKFTVVLFVFQFYPVYNFGKFISFELGTVRSKRVNQFEEYQHPIYSYNKNAKHVDNVKIIQENLDADY